LTQIQPLLLRATQAQTQLQGLRTAVNTTLESWNRPGAQVPQNVRTAAADLLKKIDAAYESWGGAPSTQANISEAGPPLVERPVSLAARIAQLAGGIENTSAAPTEWELAQIQILAQKIPAAADVVQKLVREDLPALNKLMREANMDYIVIPGPGGAAGGGRRPPADDNDEPIEP
jgi:hypothetical protein